MMNDDDLDEFLEANFREMEQELYEQEVTESPVVYWRFGRSEEHTSELQSH